MKVIFAHDWHDMFYDCRVSDAKKIKIFEVKYDSTDSEIRLSELEGMNMYLVELWGGNGPSINEFHLVDSKNAALSSLNDFYERCNECLWDEDEIQDKNRLFDELRKTYFNID